MRHRQITRGLGVLAIVCALVFSNSTASAALPFIQSHGTQFVDETGAPVTLKGCNLGNYLLIELWMFGGCIEVPDQAHLFAKLNQRFGSDRARHLMDEYRESWITPRDFDLIRSFGFNVVRLPIDYRLLQSDEAPYEMKPDGFKYIDHVLDMAETAGVYVILDLHAAPGGQSDDQCTGEKGTNKLWNNPVNQQRTADVWRAMSTRYRDRSIVAGYDLMNEPYADHHMDVRDDLRKIMSDCYTAIRGTGDKHVMFFPGALGKSPEFYGDPHTSGWTNVGFTEHFYPGLFGDKVAFESHIRTLTKTFPARQQWLDRVQSPYYVGEFNPVLDATGGPRITRAYYDAFARHAWAGTIWSYKIVKPTGGATSNTWYCVSNADPLPKLNLDSSTYEDFERFFAGMAATPLAVNQPLLKALTQPDPEQLPLGDIVASPTVALPADAHNLLAPPGWSTIDIGQAAPGAVSIDADGALTITAGGTDIFGRSDSFRFVSRPADPTGEFTARIDSLLESDTYAKAGVMARWGDDPAAAFAMANTFPDGTVAFVSRSQPGEEAKEIKSGSGSFPIDLRLAIKDGRATGFYRRPAGEWTELGSAPVPASPEYRVGFAVDSHSDELTRAVIRSIDSNSPSAIAVAASNESLLKNGSFEDAGTNGNIADNWNSKGGAFTRQTDAAAAHSGSAVMVGHPGQANWREGYDLSQDVSAVAGKRYHFTVFAERDGAGDGDSKVKIELRLEGNLDGHAVTLNTTTANVSELGTANKWARLTLDGTAIGDTLRVRIILTSPAARGGAIRFDDAALQVLGDGK